MKIINVNLNGIRSAAKKKFFPWIKQQKADFICIQEVRAKKVQLCDPIFELPGYQSYFVSAKKGGYSGVAIYTKHQPKNIITDLTIPYVKDEGRYLQLDFANIKIASIYVPSGTSGEIRQKIKMNFLADYKKILEQQIKDPIPYIICGDFNIAHKNIDLKNWKSNQKSSGFLPEERAWLDEIFNDVGFVDAYRYKNPDKIEYTWWSNFGKAWLNNVGWRIDYQIISPQLKDEIISAQVYREEKFSDHAPVIIEYNIKV